MRRWLPLTTVCALICAHAGAAAAGAAYSRIASGLEEELAHAERIEVVVALRPPATTARNRGGIRQRLKQIARRQAAVFSAIASQVGPEHTEIHHQFATASGFTASVSRAGLAALAAQPDVVRIEPMQEGSAALGTSVPQINADTVRALGIDGRGVAVAVLDTAIDTAHPDLQGHIMAEECFCTSACCPGRKNRRSGPGSATGTGAVHGTHVTGIIVSQGTHRIASIGVAPGAQVVAIRVLDDQERGSLGDWVAALDWLAANHAALQPAVRAVNMSLVSGTLFPINCEPLSVFNTLFGEVIDTLRTQGTLVFAAAGNNGDATMLAAPACVTKAVAVGYVDRWDTVAAFSNSGLGLDLLAPGVAIESTAPYSSTDISSGTSMATPHAVGVAALLWNAAAELTPDEVEIFLRRTGVPVLDPRNGLRFPRIDAFAAYDAVRRTGSLVRGGGSRLSDCLVEWAFVPRSMIRARSRPIAVCRDGDPTCDHDEVAGQCTFELSLCFNVPDGRIAHCRTNDPITRVTLHTPLPDIDDPVDTGNAAALSAVLPVTPLVGQRVCSGATYLTVPITTGARGGRSVHLTAESLDRRDADRARLVCLTPQ